MQKWLSAIFFISFNADYFYFYADQRISNNICHFVPLENQRRPVLSMGMKHQGCPIYLDYQLGSQGGIFLCYDHLVLCLSPYQKPLLLSWHDMTWHVTCDMWHVSCDMWHVTQDMWHMIHDMLWWVSILSKCQLPSSYCLWFIIFQRFGGKGWLSELMNEWWGCM